MKFVFTLEPFAVKSISVASIIDQIMRSMSFDSDKALRYDPKGIMHQRRIKMNFRGYDAEHDEVLATLVNTDLLEHVELGNGSSSNGDQSNPNQEAIKQTTIPTPLKVEKSLKRPSTDTMEVDENTSTKRPRLSELGK